MGGLSCACMAVPEQGGSGVACNILGVPGLWVNQHTTLSRGSGNGIIDRNQQKHLIRSIRIPYPRCEGCIAIKQLGIISPKRLS